MMTEKLQRFYKDKQVLITGGAGFIGSHLTEKLVELGAHVTVFDNLSSGNLANLAHVRHAVHLLQDDITNRVACAKAVMAKDIIFHLAAFVSVPASVEDPIACSKTNVDGTLHLLDAARHAGIKRFIFSSSSAVYGNKNAPCTEQDPCVPTSPYGLSKLIAEFYCRLYAEQFNLPTVCLRYFNVYGKRQRPDGPYAGVFAKFKKSMAENEPITIFGDGLQTRDFVAVHQVVYANLIMAMLNASECNGQAVNIASGKSITLLQLLEQLKQQFPLYNQPPVFQPARSGDLAYSQANCTKYHTLRASLE